MSKRSIGRRLASTHTREETLGNSSDDDGDQINDYSHKQNGRNYVIDLRSFHKTKLRIETELRNSEMANDIMDTYCSDGVPFKEVNPLLATDGVFPLIKFIYEHDSCTEQHLGAAVSRERGRALGAL